jgi:hypothetical protein
MKNVIVFAAIMLVFGSLKKDDSPKCPQRVQAVYYLNGKKVGKEVRTDSIAYKIIY